MQLSRSVLLPCIPLRCLQPDLSADELHRALAVLAPMQACQVTVWVEDAQGAKRALHSICATLKPDGSREYRIDCRIKSGKEVKVKLSGIPLPGQLSAACMKRQLMAPKYDTHAHRGTEAHP